MFSEKCLLCHRPMYYINLYQVSALEKLLQTPKCSVEAENPSLGYFGIFHQHEHSASFGGGTYHFVFENCWGIWELLEFSQQYNDMIFGPVAVQNDGKCHFGVPHLEATPLLVEMPYPCVSVTFLKTNLDLFKLRTVLCFADGHQGSLGWIMQVFAV